MKVPSTIDNIFWRWLDYVAETVISIGAKIRPPRTVRLVETNPGQFEFLDTDNSGKASSPPAELSLENGKFASGSVRLETLRGTRIEFSLRPDRFIFKSIELPSRAAEFLDGVVRAQIDRLTPWSPDEAAFGFDAPAEVGSDRMLITIAATARALLLPLLQAVKAFGPVSIVLGVQQPEAGAEAPPITVMQENAGGLLDIRSVRRILLIVLGSALLIALAAGVTAHVVDNGLRAQQDAIARRIVQTQNAAIAARNNLGDPMLVAERSLAERKHTTPSAVIALEILSQILPDNTYVTELHIEADKLRLSGITHDAPALIRLIEQTRHFKDATFFAPITRSTSDTGDRFNIEAKMEPNFSLTP
jgi:general secretion pathway protein L